MPFSYFLIFVCSALPGHWGIVMSTRYFLSIRGPGPQLHSQVHCTADSPSNSRWLSHPVRCPASKITLAYHIIVVDVDATCYIYWSRTEIFISCVDPPCCILLVGCIQDLDVYCWKYCCNNNIASNVASNIAINMAESAMLLATLLTILYIQINIFDCI